MGGARGLLWTGLLTLVAGCGAPTSQIELVSHKDPYFGERYNVPLSECSFRVDAGGDYHFAARAMYEPSDGGEAITQLLHVHVFWKPRPGTTFANASATNATVRYVVASDSGASVYSGTAFVFPKRRRFSKALLAQIQDARLSLDGRMGDLPELLGDTRMSGELLAERDPNTVVAVMREIERYARQVQGP